MALTHLQFYLTKLAEEAVEVAQISLKTQQFGPEECMPGQPYNNFERCHQELDDLNAMVQELNNRFDFNYIPDPARIRAKMIKVRRYLDFSIAQGMVDGESVKGVHPDAGFTAPTGRKAPNLGQLPTLH